MAANRSARNTLSEADPVQVIADSPLLRSIERSSLDGLGPALEWIDLDERDILSPDGNRGDALYFIASGRLEIVNASGERDSAADDDHQVLAVIIAGHVISEMQTLTGSSDVAAARCATAARIVRLAKEGFDLYLITNPDVGAKLENIFAPRFNYNDMIRVLRNMFGDLTEEVQADIEQRLTWRHVPRETALFRQGKSSGSQFVVISGRLRELTRSNTGGERIVSEITQGETVGEMGVFTDEIQTT